MIHSLSYVGFGSPKFEEWVDFGTNVLGCELASRGADNAVRLRIDDLNYRIAIHPGERDELRYVGWATANETSFHDFVAHLEALGIDYEWGKPDELEERQVPTLVWWTDPLGHRHEVVWGKKASPTTFNSPRGISGFLTGAQGLGHVVFIVPDLVAGHEYYTKVFGLRLSDRIAFDRFNIRFYHVNGRHHTFAMAEMPGMTGVNHLMLEVLNLDDVGKTIDIINASDGKNPIVLSLGRHSNDRMTSFYVDTPSSVKIEYGYGASVIQRDEEWLAQSYTSNSIWGHRPTEAMKNSSPGIVYPVEPIDDVAGVS
jgi:2,3-dihydroxybiphenyl 1,2-dioxygenase